MKSIQLKALRRIVLAIGVGSLGSAHAGLVSGSWDPLFGAPLANLSWSGQAQFLVPDTCSALADGSYSVLNPACAGSAVNFAVVKFFDKDTDPTGTQSIDFKPLGLVATDVKVYNHQIAAVVTNLVIGANPSGAPAAQGNLFGLQFSLSSPALVCVFCSPTGPNINNGNVIASVDGMEQIFTSYYDNGAPKLVDSNGNPVGIKLNGMGEFQGYTTTPVPEPASWALMLGGLLTFSMLRRRRR
jgi:hypothetical protein